MCSKHETTTAGKVDEPAVFIGPSDEESEKLKLGLRGILSCVLNGSLAWNINARTKDGTPVAVLVGEPFPGTGIHVPFAYVPLESITTLGGELDIQGAEVVPESEKHEVLTKAKAAAQTDYLSRVLEQFNTENEPAN